MIWARVDRWFQRSDAGYQVSASGGADGYLFAAWSPDGVAPGLIGFYRDAPAARQACEDHHAAQAAGGKQ